MFTPGPEAWKRTDESFPTAGTLEEKWRFLLRYALLAPSSHNTQPWHFQLEGERLGFYADRSRVLPYIDPQHRELRISCGTALFHLRVALKRFGYAGAITLFPRPDDLDLLAHIELGEPVSPTPEDRQLFESIFQRHTNREPFQPARIPLETLERLKQVAVQDGAWLRFVAEGTARDALVTLIAQADAEQLADPRFRSETERWLRPDNNDRGDGVPRLLFGMPGLITYGGPFQPQAFDTGAHYAARERQLKIHSPLLAVLGTDADTPHDWLQAGQALAHVLLLAAEKGIAASFFNAPVEIERLRPKVRNLVGGMGFPQLVFRLGYGPEVKPTPRRAVSDTMEECPV